VRRVNQGLLGAHSKEPRSANLKYKTQQNLTKLSTLKLTDRAAESRIEKQEDTEQSPVHQIQPDDDSDEQHQTKKLQASPDIVAWRQKSSYHFTMVQRQKTKREDIKRQEEAAKMNTKILGLADLKSKDDLFQKIEEEERRKLDRTADSTASLWTTE
jgi:hypothetical protein